MSALKTSLAVRNHPKWSLRELNIKSLRPFNTYLIVSDWEGEYPIPLTTTSAAWWAREIIMVLDPLPALSFAGAVVQFVDFSCKTFSTAHNIYQSDWGSLTSNDNLKFITASLKDIFIKLKRLRMTLWTS